MSDARSPHGAHAVAPVAQSEERAGLARRAADRPADPTQWIVRVAHENLLPAKRMNVFRRLRFRLFVFLRLVSRPAYCAYGLGDEVRLSVEVMPVTAR
jgi:hypothetical protein